MWATSAPYHVFQKPEERFLLHDWQAVVKQKFRSPRGRRQLLGVGEVKLSLKAGAPDPIHLGTHSGFPVLRIMLTTI